MRGDKTDKGSNRGEEAYKHLDIIIGLSNTKCDCSVWKWEMGKELMIAHVPLSTLENSELVRSPLRGN